MSNEHDIKVLNSLIETTLDSADGYREAAKDAENPAFRSLFEQRSFERQRVTSELQAAVRTLGGEPEDDGSVLAGAHRAFLNLKSSVTGRDDTAVIKEVENGEDYIKGKFEKAMQDQDLAPVTREVLNRAYASVREGHDQVSQLKHSMQGKTH